MERVTKLLLILTVFVVGFASNGEGARTLKSKEMADKPQNFFGGGTGRSFPTPGFSGIFPTPGFSGTLPTPGFSGTFPSPGFSFGSPAGTGNICAFFPGTAGCVPARPTNTGSP